MPEWAFYENPMSTEIEEWRPVVGYEGRYEVSDLGNVRSLSRIETRSDGRTFQHPGGPLKPSVAKQSGHVRVNLRKDGKSKTAWVHQLVASTFIGERPAGQEVCHNDGIPSNNGAANLKWGTRNENIEDRRRHGTLIIGEAATGSILKEAQVVEIKARLGRGETGASLAKEFGVANPTISNINTGKRWAHV
jgi:hypothetical protein